MDWKIEALRLTLFQRIPVSNEDISGWWESIVGAPPEIDNINRVSGERRQEGNFLNGRLIFDYKLDRIDWNILPILDIDAMPPTLGEVDEIYSSFIQAFSPIIQSIDVKRFAVGTVCNYECEDHKSAYEFLNSKLPFVELSDNSFEFSYQINRPRDFTVSFSDNYKINRLSKWHASKGLFTHVEGRSAKFYASKCELDINTDANYQNSIPASEINDLFKLLIEFSNEILAKGDCE